MGAARPSDDRSWAISGDGGFQMNTGRDGTMVQEGIEVKLAVFNTATWAWSVSGRVLPFGRHSNTPILSPDYVKLATPTAFRLARRQGSRCDRRAAAACAPGRRCCGVVIEQEANVFFR